LKESVALRPGPETSLQKRCLKVASESNRIDWKCFFKELGELSQVAAFISLKK
jgi:hypothetical protein